MARILLVDQETRVHEAVSSVLTPMGHDVTTVCDAEGALAQFKSTSPEIVIAEVEIAGIDLLRKIRETSAATFVILTTAFPRKEVAVSALRAGAFDLLLKPLNVKDFVAAIHRALAAAGVKGHEQPAATTADSELSLHLLLSMTGSSPKAEGLRKQVHSVCESRVRAPIVLQGPSGAGKRELANYLHKTLANGSEKFCTLDCRELDESELRSQLVGEDGAAGPVFAEYKGGTILLESVDLIPETLQDELAGFAKAAAQDILWICSSDLDLDEALAAGDFSMKLYFQISGKVIELPPLKDRTEDLREMTAAILKHSPSVPEARREVEFTDEAIALLEAHDWPENLVELERVVAMAAMESKGARVGVTALRRKLQAAS